MPTLLRAKCIIVGDATSGKSSICQVFHSDGSFYPKNYNMTTDIDLKVKQFNSRETKDYTMTTGAELTVKQINIPDTKDGVELFLYDSAGKEMFSDYVTKFWEHPSLVVVVYDCTSETSFNSCQKWLERVRQQAPDCHIPGVLIANKIDLDQRRIISPKMGNDFATSNGLKYFECSAKEMQGVDTAFYYLANEYYKLYLERIETFKSLGLQ